MKKTLVGIVAGSMATFALVGCTTVGSPSSSQPAAPGDSVKVAFVSLVEGIP